jgi:hypothetical protein
MAVNQSFSSPLFHGRSRFYSPLSMLSRSIRESYFLRDVLHIFVLFRLRKRIEKTDSSERIALIFMAGHESFSAHLFQAQEELSE